MRPRKLDWVEFDRDGERKLEASVITTLVSIRVTVSEIDRGRWALWFERIHGKQSTIFQSTTYDTMHEAQLSGDGIWARLVQELLRDEE